MPHGFADRPRPARPSRVSATRQIRARSDGPSWTELAVEKIAGLLALAVGVGLAAPLLFVVQQGDTDGVGAVVVAVLSGITIVAGVMLLVGYHPDEDRQRFD